MSKEAGRSIIKICSWNNSRDLISDVKKEDFPVKYFKSSIQYYTQNLHLEVPYMSSLCYLITDKAMIFLFMFLGPYALTH